MLLDIQLLQTQMDILLGVRWLDDKIVNAAQTLLCKQFNSPVLQTTTLVYTLVYDIIRRPFVQILHNGKDHLLTVSTIGLQPSYISVYDSMYSNMSSFTKDHAHLSYTLHKRNDD